MSYFLSYSSKYHVGIFNGLQRFDYGEFLYSIGDFAAQFGKRTILYGCVIALGRYTVFGRPLGTDRHSLAVSVIDFHRGVFAVLHTFLVHQAHRRVR